MPQSTPKAAILLEAAVKYLETELMPTLDGYHRFQELVQQYAQLVVEKTRAQREAGSKKKTRRPNSSWPKTRKSSS